jgi:hypothetical protein
VPNSRPVPVLGYQTDFQPRGRGCSTNIHGLRVVCMRYTMTTLIHKSADWEW